MTAWSREALQSPTGAVLNFHWREPAKPPRAIIQVNHGMAEHAARYARFADYLASRGYATIAHDHRGHGHTKAPDAPLGVFAANNGMAKVLDDVSAVMAQARTRSPGTPLVMFGHSMGTIIALHHAHENPGMSDAAAFWNTSFDTPFLLNVLVAVLKTERFLKGSDVPSSFAVKATFEAWNKEFAPNRTAFDWLSRDSGGSGQIRRRSALRLSGFGRAVARRDRKHPRLGRQRPDRTHPEIPARQHRCGRDGPLKPEGRGDASPGCPA